MNHAILQALIEDTTRQIAADVRSASPLGGGSPPASWLGMARSLITQALRTPLPGLRTTGEPAPAQEARGEMVSTLPSKTGQEFLTGIATFAAKNARGAIIPGPNPGLPDQIPAKRLHASARARQRASIILRSIAQGLQPADVVASSPRGVTGAK